MGQDSALLLREPLASCPGDLSWSKVETYKLSHKTPAPLRDIHLFSHEVRRGKDWSIAGSKEGCSAGLLGHLASLDLPWASRQGVLLPLAS